MYTREIRPSRANPRITPPDNYGGTAFIEQKMPLSPIALPAAQPTPLHEPEHETNEEHCAVSPDMDSSRRADADAHEKKPEKVPEEKEEAAPAVAEPKKQQAPGKGILSSLIPGGLGCVNTELGFEELLLIALIFLLSQSETDRDILILLAFLLFYQ